MGWKDKIVKSKFLIPIIIFFLIFGFIKIYPDKNISSCKNIYYKGTYELSEDLLYPLKNDYCIKINGNDITLDCKGHLIKASSMSCFLDGIGGVCGAGAIRAQGKNITIKNCLIENMTKEDQKYTFFQYALLVEDANKVLIENNTFISDNFITSFGFRNSDNVTFLNNKVNGADITFYNSNYGLVENNEFGNNSFSYIKEFRSKILISKSKNTIVTNNTIRNGIGAFELYASENSVIYSNEIDNFSIGFIVINSTNDKIIQNKISNTNVSLYLPSSDTYNNLILENTNLNVTCIAGYKLLGENDTITIRTSPYAISHAKCYL